MDYFISKKELKRRKLAYLNLSLNLLVGVFIGSMIFRLSMSIIAYVLISAILLLIAVFSFYFLNSLYKLKVTLSDKSLERTIKKHTEKYALNRIDRIKVKRTSKNTIREIYIWLKDGRAVFISGLANFEQFRLSLLKRIDKKINVIVRHEPLNYDHPLFYTIFGWLVGILSVLSFKSLPLLNYQQANILLLGFVVYLILFGIYFLLAKPLSKSYGKKTQLSDYSIGFFMIAAGLAIYFLD